MRLITTLIALAVAVAVVLFAISNRATVTLELWPLPYSIDVGIYAAVLVAILIGFVGGAVAMWLAGGAKRRELRQTRRRVKDLEHSLAQAKSDSGSAAA
ncbi:MAG: DUF1049 domain-containing protein [Rhodobacteraceae bacterium]|nr:DUF1049 domain-containing protein [Paracoccaceae bacterium]